MWMLVLMSTMYARLNFDMHFFEVFENKDSICPTVWINIESKTYIFKDVHKPLKRGDIVKEIEVVIDTEEIAEFFYNELVRRGYVPAESEIEELADIMFDYLLEKCIIDEEIE